MMLKDENKYIKLLLLILFQASLCAQTSLMSYNIRYDNQNDNENWWGNRKEEVVGMIQYYSPDILGIQEGLHTQVTYLDDNLSSYAYIGVGRDDGEEKGEYVAVFYNTEKFELINSNTYWLSETPDEVSVGWDASMERITTYGVFRNILTNDTLHVFNCHFDHLGHLAREKSSELLLTLIKQEKLEEKKVILMGDLNSEPKDSPIQLLKTKLKDSYEIARHPVYGPVGTFNQFDVNLIPEKRIDYIFCKNLKVRRYRAIDDRRTNNLCLSDHLPILVDL